MRVLLVEDDSAAASGIAVGLRGAGMVVDLVDTGEEAIDCVRHYDFDVILLDLRLPDIDGFEVLRRLRASRLHTPVLIISGERISAAKLKGFSTGADDYVVKPFDLSELKARIQAVVRRSRGFSRAILSLGPLKLSPDTREVFVDGTPVHLTGKEFAILELLLLRKGMALTKEAFLNHLYGGMDEPEAKIIDVFICKLRKKLSLAGASDLIATVWGRGYMMRDPVNTETATTDLASTRSLAAPPALAAAEFITA